MSSKGGSDFSGLMPPQVKVTDFAACAFVVRVRYRVNVNRGETSFLKDGQRPFFNDHGCIVCMVLFVCGECEHPCLVPWL